MSQEFLTLLTDAGTKQAVNVSNQIPVKASSFVVSVQLVRPANTTAYAAGDIINSGPTVNCATTDTSTTVTPSNMAGIFVGMAVSGTGIAANTVVATVGTSTITLDKAATATNASVALTFTNTASLPCLDFSAFGGYNGQTVEIRSAIISSSNGAATTKLSAQIAFFKTGAMQANCADNTAFAPAYATVITNKTGRMDDVSSLLTQGSNCYEIMQADVARLVELGASGKIYAAILTAAAYTPASGEILTLTVKGILH